MKAFTEGARAMMMWTALHSDIAHRHPDAKTREAADDLVQLLTPIVKSTLTDGGFATASTALQCFGGYGYIEEYGASQYLRDARITMIYEGTNGIQAMDLVGRKLPFETGRYLQRFFHPLDAFIAQHNADSSLQEFIGPLTKHTKLLQQATMWLGANGAANPNQAAAGATEYLQMFSLVVQAYLWAKQAHCALQLLQSGEAVDSEFLNAKLASARFFYAKMLPENYSLLASITAGSDSVMANAGW
jgi:hypothetical protein